MLKRRVEDVDLDLGACSRTLAGMRLRVEVIDVVAGGPCVGSQGHTSQAATAKFGEHSQISNISGGRLLGAAPGSQGGQHSKQNIKR